MVDIGIQDEPSTDHGRHNHKDMVCVVLTVMLICFDNT